MNDTFLRRTYHWLGAADFAQFKARLHSQHIPAGTVLLREGEPATRLYLLERGCVRAWIDKQGRELTCQFFTAGQRFTALGSFADEAPSLFTFEAIEASDLYWTEKADVRQVLAQPDFQAEIVEFLRDRQLHYIQEFLSFIKHSPTERYQRLLRERPDLVRRVPATYLASYLGITPESLSRLKARLSRQRA